MSSVECLRERVGSGHTTVGESAVAALISGLLCGVPNVDGDLFVQSRERRLDLVQARRMVQVKQAIYLAHVAFQPASPILPCGFPRRAFPSTAAPSLRSMPAGSQSDVAVSLLTERGCPDGCRCNRRARLRAVPPHGPAPRSRRLRRYGLPGSLETKREWSGSYRVPESPGTGACSRHAPRIGQICRVSQDYGGHLAPPFRCTLPYGGPRAWTRICC